ncbi:agmatinase [Spirochaeta thermophila]|uniref:Putative agmatinase n=1 Tax=Winmispira thermophila (strain ATCC 49972 / DSM 6192 / RI 19.B1) TaxID=665571 RepID=E0RP79_WINT6|nr:agmatinase [Spirochaeta thermophila]ADN01273.1 putative agmatinase [Spirochaeta thermophila DSM 6192]
MRYPHFLHSEIPNASPEEAFFHVIPVPYERTTSFGKGAARGPSAILEASGQLEVWDGRGIPAEVGIHTGGPVKARTPERMAREVAARMRPVLRSGRVPVLLGGEHTVSVGAWEALKEVYGPGQVGIVQIDAHADLRDTYEGSRFSHACVMRRALDHGFSIFQAGVRSLSPGEVALRRELAGRQVFWKDAPELRRTGAPLALPPDFPSNVYLTIDVDGFDPSVVWETGTPEPGGLFWYEVLDFIERVAEAHTVVGFDVVELAPAKGSHVGAFVAARLVYQVMGIVFRHPPRR